MKIQSIIENDTVNSITGFTLSIFFSGCSHKCKGCFSKQTWNWNNGQDYSREQIIELIVKNRHNNVSLLGGDPFYVKNREDIIWLIKEIKKLTNKKIYVWTGYLKEKVDKWLDTSLIDYLIDGKFELEKKDLRLLLRGSSNQNIYTNGILKNND